jgi:catechol 2,3-dioxygenase-like lactoylglutathione lyase family enzyme
MRIVEIARFVDNVESAKEFYRALLGVEPTYADAMLATFEHLGVTYLVHQRYVPGSDDLPCEDHVAFGVADVDATVKLLVGRGLTVEFGPRDYDWGRSAYLREPGGSLIEICQTGPHQAG